MRFSSLSFWLFTLLVLAQLPTIVHARLSEPQYSIEILSVETGVYSNGEWFKKTLFSHLEHLEVQITIRTITSDLLNVYLTFTVIDSNFTPIMFNSRYQLIGSEVQSISTHLGPVPLHSSLGGAVLSVNALTDPPTQGGKPLCPQVQHEFLIWWNTADINRDYQVTLPDMMMVCSCYGSSPSDPVWNEHCDIAAPYGRIDVFDITKVLSSYSDKWEPV
jgi:hypothetical protein